MRQDLQKIGIIAILIIAGISLPLSITSLTNTKPTIINNYYYTYYNQTYYGENETSNEPEPYYPPETASYYNLTGTPLEYVLFHHRVYNLTGDYVINWIFNQTQIDGTSFLFIIQDYMLDLWLENISYSYHGDGFSGAGIKKKQWDVPFSDTWHIYFGFQLTSIPSTLNITIRTLINKI